VADSHNNRLQRITPDGGVAVVGSRGFSRGQFMTPMDVAVDEFRSFYVIEQNGHRLQKFSCEGVLQLVIGKAGSRPGEFRNPMSVAVSMESGDIYVADTGNSRIQRFDREGNLLNIIGTPETGQPALSNPQAVTCDQEGRVYVADTFARRIVQYDPMGRFLGYYGGVIGQNQKQGSIALQLDEPRAIDCSDLGRLFIADGQRGGGRLSVLEIGNGHVETTVTNPGRSLGTFARPCGLAITPVTVEGMSTGDVYISDTMNHRIIRFTWT
jgi:DNA-binding beta-propeller fold protein YncE